MHLITQEHTEMAFTLGIILTIWTTLWAYSITLSLRTDVQWMIPAEEIQENKYHPVQDPLPVYTEALPVPEPLPILNNRRTSEPFHRNEHVILFDLNSNTRSIRNNAGNTSDAGTVHSDAIYRIHSPDVLNPSNNDDTFIITGTATPDEQETRTRARLAEAVANAIR
jgi:hypothetical protein